MNIKILPRSLSGTVRIPASKSIMHRALICAALSDGVSQIESGDLSNDISATIHCLEALGAKFIISQSNITVVGIDKSNIIKDSRITFDCKESGSTIRFMIPIAAALGISAKFIGCGKLSQRPLHTYSEIFDGSSVKFSYNGSLPCSTSGKLQSGHYKLHGNVSSQFVSGLLFALSLLDGDSVLEVLPPFESKSYVALTVDILKKSGILVEERENCYYISGGQKYISHCAEIESDYSQAAFFLVANCLGSQLTLTDFNLDSIQGDSYILKIIEQIGGKIELTDGELSVNIHEKKAFHLDAKDIPDLVPILCVLACFCAGTSTISGTQRLRLKESDRISSTLEMITRLGGKIDFDDGVITIIGGLERFCAAEISSYNDHRIAMCAAIAATMSTGNVVLLEADSVHKSYPNFFLEYERLGGKFYVFNLV